MNRKEQIFAKLQKSKNLPSLPQVLLKLIDTCKQDDIHLSEITNIIDKDPSISSKVLRLVNSAYFGLRNPFSNLDQAVIYLGANTIKNISVAASVQQVFGKLNKNDQFSLSYFWWKSFSSATYAKRIAKKINSANVEEAYLAALLHDLGELLFWMNFEQECVQVHQRDNGKSQCQAEEEQIGINHCEAGAWLVKHWRLNSFIGDSILYHHASLEQIEEAFPLVKIIYLAEIFCQSEDNNFELVYEAGNRLLEISTKQIDEIQEGAQEEVQAIADSLQIEIKRQPLHPGNNSNDLDNNDIDLLHHVKNQSLLHNFLKNLIQAENRNAILLAAEQALSILFDFETMFFFLNDFENNRLFGCTSAANRFSNRMGGLFLSVSQEKNLLIKSMLDKHLVIVTQQTAQQFGSIADAQLLEASGENNLLYIPMTARAKPVGVIVIGLPDSPGFDLEDKLQTNLLSLLADQAAMSLYLDEVKNKQDEKIQTARMATASMAAAKIVHEVNNPLGIIRNYLKILEMKLPNNSPSIKEITILGEEINRVSTIIQQFNAFSIQGKQKLAVIDVNSLLTKLLSILSKSFFYSSKLKVHFSPGENIPDILTDGAALKQIVINLVKNASEAMKEGGSVKITTNLNKRSEEYNLLGDNNKQDHLNLIIQDNGPGLPKEISSQLFTPFTSTKGKGHSGLGLSIVQTLVTELNGSITCTTDKAKGTRFSIILPISQGLVE